MKRAFFLCLPVLLVGATLIGWWQWDAYNDRKHTIIANTPTPVFAGTSSESGCHGVQLAIVERGSRFTVQKIRYRKDCATLDVVLPDGRKGYFVLGVSDVSVSPRLPTN